MLFVNTTEAYTCHISQHVRAVGSAGEPHRPSVVLVTDSYEVVSKPF